VKLFFSILVYVCLAVSCKPTAPHVSGDTVIPAITASPRPDLDSAKEGVTKAIGQNDQIKSDLEVTGKSVKNQGDEIDRAVAEAQEMKRKLENNIAVKDSEIAALISRLNRIKEQNTELSEQNAALLTKLAKQLTELNAALNKAKDASGKLVDKEKETDELRTKFEDINKDKKALEDNQEAIMKERDDAVKDAATAGVYRSWVKGLVFGFLGYLLLKNILASVFPASNILRRI
jgi:chromosome segregation ATPase